MKKNVLLCFIAGSLIAVILSGCCTLCVTESLPVTLRPQETSMWCWAASGQMAMEYLGTNVNQCTQANNRFSYTNCCNSSIPGQCVKGGWPEFEKYGFTAIHTTDAALTWKQVREEICRNINCGARPFCFTWHWTGPNGGGHMMAAIGYQTVEGANFVEVNDPWPPNVGDHYILTYNAYVSGPGYTHWDDYYEIRKK